MSRIWGEIKLDSNIKTWEADHDLWTKIYMQHSNNNHLDDPDHNSYETSEER